MKTARLATRPPELPACAPASVEILADLRRVADTAARTVKVLSDELYGALRRLPARDHHLIEAAVEDVPTMAAVLNRFADRLRTLTAGHK